METHYQVRSECGVFEEHMEGSMAGAQWVEGKTSVSKVTEWGKDPILKVCVGQAKWFEFYSKV